MGLRRHIVLAGAGLTVGACLRFSPYVCDSNEACRSREQQGICQPTGFCSYPDSGCESGQRYDEFAPGTLAERCVAPAEPETTGTAGPTSTDSGESGTIAGSTGSESTSVTETGSPEPQCGNDIVEAGEACDDGNDVDGDGCNTDCVESGTVLWDVVHPELGSVARGVAVGPRGDVAVVGGRVEDGQSDVLVLFFNRDGVAQWQRVHASPEDGTDEGRQVNFDDAGNLFVTAFETRDDLEPAQRTNAWTRQYDTQGTEGWTATYDGAGSGNDRGNDVAWAGDEVIVAGLTAGDTWLQGYAASDGAVRWTFEDGFNETAFDQAQAIVVDGDSIYVAGEMDNADEGRDAWLARLSVSGDTATADWLEVIDAGGSQSDSAYGIALAPDGGLAIGGRRGERAWLAKFQPDGTLDWERYDDDLQDPADVRGVAVDSVGQVIAIGYETDPVQGEDAFVTKYDVDGAMLWTQRYDGPAGGTDRARAVAVGPDRTIAVSGFTDAVDGRRLWVRKYAP